LALLLRRQHEFLQCGINKGNIFFVFVLIHVNIYGQAVDA
jgi:hypothetical protein